MRGVRWIAGRVAWLLVPIAAACVDVRAPDTGYVPVCAVGADADDLESSAQRLGCTPDVVLRTWPAPGATEEENRPEAGLELAKPLREASEGRGCNGPIRLARIGRVGEVPGSVQVDIVTHASITRQPLWPRARDCVDAKWYAQGHTLRLVPVEPLERFVWYEVSVPASLPIASARLCSDLAWRFTVTACGDGVLEAATSFIDWVCLGSLQAERGWFQPYEEDCDDGNATPQDGCSQWCYRETGWTCDAEGCHTRCGDGIRTIDEECDFGVRPLSGCDACHIEPGYHCDWQGCEPIDADASAGPAPMSDAGSP